MATVRITNELTDRLIRAGDAPLATQYERIRRGASFNHHAEAVWGAMWMEHASTVKALPRYAFSNGVSIRVRVPLDNGDFQEVEMTLPTPLPWPNVVPENDLIEGAAWGNRICLRPVPHWATLISEVKVWVEQMEAVDKQRKMFRDNLKKLLSAYTTLAPALKAWPALWDLLPEDVKQKHKQINDKREKQKVALDGVDLGAMTATIAVRKLTGGI